MSAWTHVVGWALIHFVWQGAILAVATAAVLRACQHRSANARYVVACVGLALMVVAPIATTGVLWSQTGERATDAWVAPSSSPETAPVALVGDADAHPFVGAHTWTSVDTALRYLVFIWVSGVLLLTTRLAGGL